MPILQIKILPYTQPCFAVRVGQNPLRNLGVLAERRVAKFQHSNTRSYNSGMYWNCRYESWKQWNQVVFAVPAGWERDSRMVH
jgi:hypothetical protein